VSFNPDDPPNKVLETSEKSGIDRFPVFADNAEPLGLINVYDILFDTESSRPLRHYMRRIITASENESAYRVVRRLRAARIGLAAVVNARQRSIGIVALEDLVRQLVQG
jgi:CBS domain containing-hemolysin-like protein